MSTEKELYEAANLALSGNYENYRKLEAQILQRAQDLIGMKVNVVHQYSRGSFVGIVRRVCARHGGIELGVAKILKNGKEGIAIQFSRSSDIVEFIKEDK